MAVKASSSATKEISYRDPIFYDTLLSDVLE